MQISLEQIESIVPNKEIIAINLIQMDIKIHKEYIKQYNSGYDKLKV